MKIKLKKASLALLLVASVTPSCGDDSGSNDNNDLPQLKQEVVVNYADMVLANYEDSVEKALDLEEAIHVFIDNPNQDNFTNVKAAWLSSREPYGQTEAYRFYDGPIDNPTDGPEGQLNAWPLDEVTIDYVEGNANAGIVNDAQIALTAENLAALNAQNDEAAVTTGYHAIEFLLWGQDLNANPQDTGLRPYTDYVSGNEGTAANQDRRREYLHVVADLLVADLGQVQTAWLKDANNNYRSSFLALDSNEALRRILVGIGSLSRSELSGERMEVALLTQAQEDEHSCFSDNTHRDIVTNFQGIKNVYLGEYTRIDGSKVTGKGLKDLFAVSDPTRNEQMLAELQKAEAAIATIDQKAKDGMAFDQQILEAESQANIQKAIDALVAFGDLIPEAATSLGINVNIAPAE